MNADAADLALQPRDGESRAAAAALVDYATMPAMKRSIRALHALYLERAAAGLPVPTTKIATLWTWSANHDWPQRAAVYDAHERQKRIAEVSEARAEMNRRHIELAQGLQVKVADWLINETNKLYKPADVLAALKVSTDLERKAMGVPPWVMELLSLPDDELAARYAATRAALSGPDPDMGEDEESGVIDERGMPLDDFLRGEDGEP